MTFSVVVVDRVAPDAIKITDDANAVAEKSTRYISLFNCRDLIDIKLQMVIKSR